MPPLRERADTSSNLTDPRASESTSGRGSVSLQRHSTCGDGLRSHIRASVDIGSAPTEIPGVPPIRCRRCRSSCATRSCTAPTRRPTARCKSLGSPTGRDRQSRGPYGNVSAATFGQPGLIDYRNPNLAEAMRVSGLVQRYGVGIPIARREMRANHQPAPDFTVAAHRVRCTVYPIVA